MGRSKKTLLVLAGVLLAFFTVIAGKAAADRAVFNGRSADPGRLARLHPMGMSQDSHMDNGDMVAERLAQWLNMKPEDLMAELESGRTLAQIMQQHGLSKSQLHDNAKSEVSAYLDRRIQAGDVKQEQKGTLLDIFDQLFDKYSDRILNHDFTTIPEGDTGGMGMHRGM